MTNAIGWCDRTLSPFIGCTHGCEYCYARRMAKRQRCEQCRAFVPHWHPERVWTPPLSKGQKPRVVFVGSMCDFACVDWEHEEDAVQNMVTHYSTVAPQHVYLVLTKAARWLSRVEWPENWGVGVSVTLATYGGSRIPVEEGERLRMLAEAGAIPLARKFVSVEPMLGQFHHWPTLREEVLKFPWIILGALSGGTVARQIESASCLLSDAWNFKKALKNDGRLFVKTPHLAKRGLLKDWPAYPQERAAWIEAHLAKEGGR